MGRYRGSTCVKAGRQCIRCLPIKQGKCQNTVSQTTISVAAVPAVVTAPAAPVVATTIAVFAASTTTPGTTAVHTAAISRTAVCNTAVPTVARTVTARAAPVATPAGATTIASTVNLETTISPTATIVVSAATTDSATPALFTIMLSKPQSSVQEPNPVIHSRVCFNWGEVDDTTFSSKAAALYEIVIYWKPNLFIPPHGTTGKRFVDELAKLFQAFSKWVPSWVPSWVHCNESSNSPTTASAKTKSVQ